MPSFLSKVFGRRKAEEAETTTTRSPKCSSDRSLLDGKFETVSPPSSPLAAQFETVGRAKDKEREASFALFRPKSRAQSLPVGPNKLASPAPHLTLNLPVPKEGQSHPLGTPFDDGSTTQALPDHVLDERRLAPLEVLSLVSTCSKAITERGGLDALGLMHPHWHSASPDVQRKLISLYVLSLASKSTSTTLSTPSKSTFNSELQYTRSSHDIAAVLRWGLRHLKLERNTFGNESSSQDEWQWYTNFREAEQAASYPTKAFSTILAPHLPSAHLDLLISTLDIISSLAAHAEANGFSGSKLSKFLGLWLLSARGSDDADDWNSFYSRWEKAGRIMEHLFLSWIRDETAKYQMPKRLVELVEHYPYSTPSQQSDGLLPRPRFSTRRYDALYVRIETVYPDSVEFKSKQHPIRLVDDALKSDTSSDLGKYLAQWEQIRRSAAGSGTDDRTWAPILSRIFSDDTIGLLSRIPDDIGGNTQQSPAGDSPTRRRSMSVGSTPNGNTTSKVVTNGNSVPNGSHKPPITSPLSSPTNWAEFSTAGFGESNISNFASTLVDKDMEISDPPPSRKSSKKRRLASPMGRNQRSSLEAPSPARANFPESDPAVASKSTSIALVQLDEAFIDFWSDALLDPISSKWPKFVIGQLKQSLELDGGEKLVNWIVIEQVFNRPSVPPARTPSASSRFGDKSSSIPLKKVISPRSSFATDRKNSSLSAAVKRFSLFGSSNDGKESNKSSNKRKATASSKSSKVGEMGEILSEEPEQEHATTAEKGKRDFMSAFPESIMMPGPVIISEVPSVSIPGPQQNALVSQAVAAKAVLPPAPEAVVQLGGTPGPQLALDSSEVPASDAAKLLPQETQEVELPATTEVIEFEPPSSSPVAIGQLSQEVDPVSGVGVDLAEVPIVSQDIIVEPFQKHNVSASQAEEPGLPVKTENVFSETKAPPITHETEQSNDEVDATAPRSF